MGLTSLFLDFRPYTARRVGRQYEPVLDPSTGAAECRVDEPRAIAIDACGWVSRAVDGQLSCRNTLTEWIRDVLVPHAEEEEQTTCRAAGELSEGRLLVASTLAEPVLIRRIASLLVAARNRWRPEPTGGLCSRSSTATSARRTR